MYSCVPVLQKHPHGRGEDGGRRAENTTCTETPPRAWGRLLTGRLRLRTSGNTPTGVGKTQTFRPAAPSRQKHPHGRGEDPHGLPFCSLCLETPPRAWGRLSRRQRRRVFSGNTPTGVGKTQPVVEHVYMQQKHPHGRGEDDILDSNGLDDTETPPRAWGRLAANTITGAKIGNTPTGVGKTALVEDIAYLLWETPPRAWGRRYQPTAKKFDVGNTPTGVGKTLPANC